MTHEEAAGRVEEDHIELHGVSILIMLLANSMIIVALKVKVPLLHEYNGQ